MISIILLDCSPLQSIIIGFDIKLQPLSSIIVGNFYEFQAGSICPRMAKGTPKASQRQPKGTPKGTTGPRRSPKGSPRVPKRVKRSPKSAQGPPKALQRHPKEAKGSQRERYMLKKSRGVFLFEVAEAPQAAATQTHRAGRPETGKKGQFLATHDKF